MRSKQLRAISNITGNKPLLIACLVRTQLILLLPHTLYSYCVQTGYTRWCDVMINVINRTLISCDWK